MSWPVPMVHVSLTLNQGKILNTAILKLAISAWLEPAAGTTLISTPLTSLTASLTRPLSCMRSHATSSAPDRWTSWGATQQRYVRICMMMDQLGAWATASWDEQHWPFISKLITDLDPCSCYIRAYTKLKNWWCYFIIIEGQGLVRVGF